MNFASISPGDSVFLDANVFVYDFAGDPVVGPACRALLERVENGEVRGVMSSHVFDDVAHRLMTLEAVQAVGWPYSGIAARLRQQPSQIAHLTRSRKALDEIVAWGAEIVDVAAADILLAADLARQHGLLSGDGLIVAVMQKQSLTLLASNDTDFDRVPGLVRYSPL